MKRIIVEDPAQTTEQINDRTVVSTPRLRVPVEKLAYDYESHYIMGFTILLPWCQPSHHDIEKQKVFETRTSYGFCLKTFFGRGVRKVALQTPIE